MLKRLVLRLRGPVFYLAIVGLLVTGAFNAPTLLRSSLETYQPLDLNIPAVHSLIGTDVGPDARPAGTTTPQSGRVVLIVVNGLGDDDFQGLPVLKRLKDNDPVSISTGAYLFSSPVPAGTPGLVTLLTGTSIEMTGGYSFDPPSQSPRAPSTAYQLQQMDNLFTAAKRSRNTTAFFGSPDWQATLSPDWGYQAAFPTEQPPNDVADAVLNFLKKKSANFTLVQLSAMDYAQRTFGPSSETLRSARESLNTAISRLTSDDQIDLNRTTVIVTGDWDTLRRAGDRWTIPLLMVGQAVQPGEWSWGRQEDVAPTIAALLGIEIPRNSQGRILSNTLSIPPIDMAEKMLALVEQRQSLGRAYRARLGLALPIAVNDPQAVDAEKSTRVAVQDYRLGLYDGIEAVVDPVLRYTRNDMTQAREEWFAQARTQRLVLAIVLAALPVAFLFYRRSLKLWLAFVAALVAAALPYLFFVLQGRSFAFNSSRLDALREGSLWRTGFGLLAGLLIVAAAFDWIERRSQRRAGWVDLQYSVITGLRKIPFPFGGLFRLCIYLAFWLVYFSGWLWWLLYYWRYGYFGPIVPENQPVPADFNGSYLQFVALSNLFGFMVWLLIAPLVLFFIVFLKRRLLGDGTNDEEEDTLVKSRKIATSN